MSLNTRMIERATAYREDALAKRGELIGSHSLVRWYDGSWCFLLSVDAGAWIFSAQLYPHGRSSILSDWEFLGRWAAAVGVPKDLSEMGNTIRTSPSAVHKWMWVE
jgi:hypothetical protein